MLEEIANDLHFDSYYGDPIDFDDVVGSVILQVNDPKLNDLLKASSRTGEISSYKVWDSSGRSVIQGLRSSYDQHIAELLDYFDYLEGDHEALSDVSVVSWSIKPLKQYTRKGGEVISSDSVRGQLYQLSVKEWEPKPSHPKYATDDRDFFPMEGAARAKHTFVTESIKVVKSNLQPEFDGWDDPGDYPSGAGSHPLPSEHWVSGIDGEVRIVVDDTETADYLNKMTKFSSSEIEDLNESLYDVLWSQVPEGINVHNWHVSLVGQTTEGNEFKFEVSEFEDEGYGKDPLDYYDEDGYGDRYYSESITSTSAIDIPPIGQPVNKRRKKVRRKNLKEWAPKFVAHQYSPGDNKMPSSRGKGVAARSPKHMTVGHYDTDMYNHGEAWPRKHNETVAMCDVDEDGSESKPQGSHISRVGKPEDGHTRHVGHDWPNPPKNRGGSIETMKGSRYTDGGLLSTEEWSTNNISSLMEGENLNVRAIFDKYADTNQYVCMEDFQHLISAYGSKIKIDEGFFNKLLEDNRRFLFHEYQDATGKFYLVGDIT